jgi:hypothetical protein
MGVRAGRWCVPLLCEQCGFVGSAVRTGFVGSAVRTRFVGSAVRTRFVGSAVRTRIEESHADPQRSQRPQREEGVSEPVPQGPPPACRQTGADQRRAGAEHAEQPVFPRMSPRATDVTPGFLLVSGLPFMHRVAPRRAVPPASRQGRNERSPAFQRWVCAMMQYMSPVGTGEPAGGRAHFLAARQPEPARQTEAARTGTRDRP